MKRIITLVVLMSVSLSVFAQQDAHYTNFMYNKLALNPAYAGSRDAASLLALYRTQWYGMEGAPNTQTLMFHTPMFKQRVGFGLGLERDEIGFSESYKINMSYAYRVKVSKNSMLQFGLSGTAYNMRLRWDRANATDIGDFEIPAASTNRWMPNFGAGVYYYSPRWYAGVSVPSLLRNEWEFTDQATDAQISLKRRHIFGMTGFIIPLSQKVKFTPNLMLKYVENSPFDMDLNLSFMFFDKVTIGATYRMGDSMDAILHWMITPQLRLGLGYDFTLSKLRTYHDGSYEVLLGYDFSFKKDKLINPRFF